MVECNFYIRSTCTSILCSFILLLCIVVANETFTLLLTLLIIGAFSYYIFILFLSSQNYASQNVVIFLNQVIHCGLKTDGK